MNELVLRLGDALIIVDVQNDFLPGGSLAVAEGDAVIAPINRYAALFAKDAHPVFATRDWHPRDHCSFKSRGGPWPPHCVADSRGADFPAGLAMPETATVISKATDPDRDAYSGLEGTGLERAIADRRAAALERGKLAEPAAAVLEHFAERGETPRIDLGGDARGVRLEPGPVHAPIL